MVARVAHREEDQFVVGSPCGQRGFQNPRMFQIPRMVPILAALLDHPRMVPRVELRSPAPPLFLPVLHFASFLPFHFALLRASPARG